MSASQRDIWSISFFDRYGTTKVSKVLTITKAADNSEERTITYEVLTGSSVIQFGEQGFYDFAAALKVATNLP